MWKCRYCGGTTFRIDNIERKYIVFDENGNIESCTKTELIKRIKCDDCGVCSDRIRDLADWESNESNCIE